MSILHTLYYVNSCSFQYFFFCFITSAGVLLTFVCNDRMSDTVDEMDSTSRGILDEAISFINRTVGVSCNLITTCRGYGDPMVMAPNCWFESWRAMFCASARVLPKFWSRRRMKLSSHHSNVIRPSILRFEAWKSAFWLILGDDCAMMIHLLIQTHTKKEFQKWNTVHSTSKFIFL